MADISQLEEKLGVVFVDKDLLLQALTHRSYLNENPHFRLDHNERLEFLGDAVIELAVTEFLYKKYPNPEGELTNWRASLVNAKLLSRLAQEIGIGEFLLLSRGEAKDTGRARQYILANAFEAVAGALYLDRGYDVAKEFTERVVIKELPTILAEQSYKDPKSRLQEEAQERAGVTPTYRVHAEWGPDHSKRFRVGVYLGKELIAEGEGPSKQEAETEAAKAGLAAKQWN
ncbi:MAG: ribonuclease III [bacterium]|nr:ribonuclease III [bacterium]